MVWDDCIQIIGVGVQVEDLARLSFKRKPLYVGVDDKQVLSTREGLEQGYCLVPSEQRFLLLFTFLKRNLTKKVMVFFSSCASVKYHAELLNYIDVPVKVETAPTHSSTDTSIYCNLLHSSASPILI